MAVDLLAKVVYCEVPGSITYTRGLPREKIKKKKLKKILRVGKILVVSVCINCS